MSNSEGSAAPASGSTDDIPSFEELAADPEIAALLDFEPVPRKIEMPGGWTPAVQREFIARLAFHGSPAQACREIDKHRSGANKLYLSPQGASFRAAWDAAVELAFRRRRAATLQAAGVTSGLVPPSIEQRCKDASATVPSALGPGQVLNEYGEPEDEASFRQRGEDARDSMSSKLLRCRRLYLMSISAEPVKRAAFEILTELPIDWARAERLEAQPDEPWRRPNMRNPDMLLTAEDGWLGELVHGPDKKTELRRQLNEWRVSQGLEPIGERPEGEEGGKE